MRHVRNVCWMVGLFAGLLALALAPLNAACVGTPLPDPPSARAEAMLLTEGAPNALTLTGTDGAIHVGDYAGASLRVTIPRLPSRVETSISPTGAFTAELPGVITDTLFLELVDPDGDVFLIAVADGGAMDDAVIVASPGGDRDGDLSPDAIDCAPDDPAVIAQACVATCVMDSDCAAGQRCMAGSCVIATEVCGNGLDDDLDGLVDDGCACRVDTDCFSGQTCMAGVCSL